MTCHTRVHPCDISKPLPRKSKGEIRKDLLNEYDALGKPGSGKTLRAVVQDVEDEMSKNLEFSINKDGKTLYLLCGGKKRVKLEDPKLKPQIFRETNTGIPYMTNGKTQTRCVRFFQMADDVESTENKNEMGDNKVHPAPAGLPGAGLVFNKCRLR